MTTHANNPRIAWLELAGNQIQRIEETTFSNLPNLLALTIGDYIEELPTLQNVPLLEGLFLFQNRLGTVSASMFKNMRKLRTLYLSNNRIETINFTMGAENFLAHLQILILSHNNITILPDNVFSMLTSLEHLELDDNQIQRLSSTSIRPITQMRTLSVARNRIERIDRGLFDNVTRLEILAAGNVCINQRHVKIFNDFEQRIASMFEQCFSSANPTQIALLVLVAPVIVSFLSK